MNDNGTHTVFVGVIGLLASLTLQQVNVFLAFLVAVATLIYVCYGIANRRLIRKRLKADANRKRDEESDLGD